jgi:transcriptional regulator with XRE-family HTH domain
LLFSFSCQILRLHFPAGKLVKQSVGLWQHSKSCQLRGENGKASRTYFRSDDSTAPPTAWLAQREIALRAGTSVPYIGHLEAGKRHPSERVLLRLSNILELDPRDLYLIANPIAAGLVKPAKVLNGRSALWALQMDRNLQRIHNISADEIKFLSRVADLGEIKEVRDLIHIIQIVRYSFKRSR